MSVAPLDENLKLGVSLGTASVLGLKRALLDEVPTTAHFLLGEDCVNNCAFCAQAKESGASPRRLSRVSWPLFPWGDVKAPLKTALNDGVFRRICLQTVECSQAPDLSLQILDDLRRVSKDVPVSVCIVPTSLARVRMYIDRGATEVGLPVDAGSARVYSLAKRRPEADYEKAWDVLEASAGLWPGQITTHLIVGLGETEEEVVKFLTRAQRAGITVGLFAFTPVPKTAMAQVKPPDLSSYRRCQLVAYLLKKGADEKDVECAEGRISRLAVPKRLLDEVAKGEPFRTSGCLHCNRPYYNERPGRAMMNYPRPLNAEEAQEALAASGLIQDIGISAKEVGA